MTPEREQQVKAILKEAEAVPKVDRKARARELCHDDTILLSEVMAILEPDDETLPTTPPPMDKVEQDITPPMACLT